MKPPFKVGDRIELESMTDDPCPIPVGTQGTVTRVTWTDFNSHWQVGVKWDNGRGLNMIVPPDRARKL